MADVSALTESVPLKPRRVRARSVWSVVRWVLGVTLLLLAGLTAAAGYVAHRFLTTPIPAPSVQPVDPMAALTDGHVISLTTTTPSWQKVREHVTVDRLRTDHRLWRRMHFGDWDTVPADVREPTLRAMIASYAGVTRGPAVWRTMTAADWDAVPQPIRAIVYLRMIWYWTEAEKVAEEFDMETSQVAQVVGAIVMTESWFEHRALNVNPWGNRDLGLAQCSDYCRDEIASMAAERVIDFTPSERDYYNPWIASRIATVWFRRELRNTDGDVDLAIRAYHRGLRNALDEKGDLYLATVQRRHDRYVRNLGRSPSWKFLADQMRSS